MSIVVSDLSERLDTLTKLVLAEPVARIGHSRVTVRPLTLRGKAFFQLEYQQGQKVAPATSRAARCSKRSNRSLTVCSALSHSAPKRRRASTSARRTARTSAPPSPARPAPP